MKDRMLEKRIAEIEKQKQDLQKRFVYNIPNIFWKDSELDARVDYEDTDDKYKLIDAKRKLNAIDAEEKEKHDVQ